MGWLSSWSSPAPGDQLSGATAVDSAPTEQSKRDFSLTEAQRGRIFGENYAKTDSSNAPGTREEQADAELATFLRSFESPTKTTTAASAPSNADAPTSEISSTPDVVSRLNTDGTLNISPTALYPASMSCRQAFDQAFYCQSFGGKFNDIYRYGHVRGCSEQWGAFWFCMRIRTYPDKDKEPLIRDFYRDRDEQRRKDRGGNSENIWELRDQAVVGAFSKDPDADDDESGMILGSTVR